MTEESEVATLVQASAKGDETAWNALVRRYAPLVLAVIRSYQLAAADVQDVSQTVWLRLVEHLADLRAPEALPGWLITTTQRECRRYQRRAQQALPIDPHSDGIVQQATTLDPSLDILRAELRQALRENPRSPRWPPKSLKKKQRKARHPRRPAKQPQPQSPGLRNSSI